MIFDGEKPIILGDPSNIGDLLIGQKAMDYALPVVIASDQSSIPVSTNPATPTGRTSISESSTSFVIKLGGTETTNYLVPNGEAAELTVFSFGGYLPSNTSNAVNAKCELYYRPNGGGVTTGQVLLATLYLNSQSFISISFASGEATFIGDGTKSLDMFVTNWSQQDAELFRQIRGYY